MYATQINKNTNVHIESMNMHLQSVQTKTHREAQPAVVPARFFSLL